VLESIKLFKHALWHCPHAEVVVLRDNEQPPLNQGADCGDSDEMLGFEEGTIMEIPRAPGRDRENVLTIYAAHYPNSSTEQTESIGAILMMSPIRSTAY